MSGTGTSDHGFYGVEYFLRYVRIFFFICLEMLLQFSSLCSWARFNADRRIQCIEMILVFCSGPIGIVYASALLLRLILPNTSEYG